MIRLKTLGGASLERDGALMEGRASQRRRLALLACLAAADERGWSRDQLIALLWPDRGEEPARHSLSQLLYALRTDLHPDAILAGVDVLRLNADVISSDIGDFDRAIKAGRWHEAASLHGGPFLDRFLLDDAPTFEQWAAVERERITRDFGRALEALATESSHAGRNTDAAELWRRRAALDPLDARVALGLMEAMVATGDRAGAVRHAQLHAALLNSELDAAPDPGVSALAAKLRSEPVAASLVAADAPPQPPAPLRSSDLEGTPQRPSVSPARPWPRVRSLVGATLVALFIIVAGIGLNGQRRDPAEGTTRVIVLGEVTGPDTSLALAVMEALQAELAASPGIRLVPESQLREARRLMSLGEESRLAPHLLEDLAQRQGAQVLLLGRVTPLGTGAQMLIRVIDPSDGRLLFAVTERPERADGVVNAVTRLSQAVRAQIGALPSDTAIQPLPMVATTSLPALRSYALAQRERENGRNDKAIVLAEAAILEDSLFPLAHYLAGDLLWFSDRDTRSVAHMTRAFELSDRAPLREQLLIRARYFQLVRDEPDSALATWQLLLAGHPNDALAYEGMGWTLRALGRFGAAAAAATTAMQLDPRATRFNISNRMYSYFSLGDTAAALAATVPQGGTRAHAALAFAAQVRGDFASAMQWNARDEMSAVTLYHRHLTYIAWGRVDSAEVELALLRRHGSGQFVPGALLLHATAIAGNPRNRVSARRLARDALDWLVAADLSPPANARIAERVACVAAWTSDVALLADARRFLKVRDAGRDLRSYRIALVTMDAAEAFIAGDYRRASDLLTPNLRLQYFARSIATTALLNADALAAAGDSAASRAAYTAITNLRMGDHHHEVWIGVRTIAAERLRRQATPTPVASRTPD